MKITNKSKLLILLTTISVSSLIYLFSSVKKESLPPPSPTPSSLPSPSPTAPLGLVSVNPPAGIHESIWTSTAIGFSFNQPVNIKTIQYSVSPSIETIPFTDPSKNTVYIRPKTEWATNTAYKINITSLNSLTNQPISNEVSYSFKIILPKNINSY